MVESKEELEKVIDGYDKKIKELSKGMDDIEIESDSEIQSIKEEMKPYLEGWTRMFSPKDILKIARETKRPQTLDYLNGIFRDFIEMKGDRSRLNDKAIVGGIAMLDDISCIVLGQHKGKNTEERVNQYNFGMARPEGYAKAMRLMKFAEKFGKPVIILVDTPGASPMAEAEESCQAWRIAQNIYGMAELKSPIISVVIGEGGSGGALAIDVSNKRLMLEYSYYSVISPEGCAAILFREANPATIAESAKNLQITSTELYNKGIVDEVIKEPLGGAHRDYQETFKNVKDAILRHLLPYLKMTPEEIVKDRFDRYRNIGKYIVKV